MQDHPCAGTGMYLDLAHTHGVGQMHGLRNVVVAVLVIS